MELSRTQLINTIIKKFKYKSYLEIGSGDGIHFNNIKCKDKTSVDPNKLGDAMFKLTSDQFFKTNKKKFDIIFIDGLHESEQVYKDIENALIILTDNGTVVCHDMLPTSEEMQLIPRIQEEWTGDCWKAFVRIANDFSYDMHTIDTDYGCGIIRNTQDNPHHLYTTMTKLDYTNFSINKKEWMNIKSKEWFIKNYGN